MKKYLIIDPWPAGFCNVLMSYDIGFAVAYVTGREVILPPTSWCVLIDGMANDKRKPRNEWQNIWGVFDRDSAAQEFKIHDLLTFEQFQPIIDNVTDTDPQGYSWFNENAFTTLNIPPTLNDSPICLYDSTNKIDKADFLFFSKSRPTVDLNSDVEFMKIKSFGHYWYNVYAAGPTQRNEMKQKVHNSLRYKTKYYDLVEDVFESVHPSFNAVHIRDPWQLIFNQYPDVIQYQNKPRVVLEQISSLFDNDIPLYISTDIDRNRGFFDILKQEYNVLFYEDFNFSTNTPLEKIAIDQIICSRADVFYGSFYSTFSKRINMMRGMDGRPAFDYMGFNKIIETPDYYNNPIPWQHNGNKHWNWYDSVHPHWTME